MQETEEIKNRNKQKKLCGNRKMKWRKWKKEKTMKANNKKEKQTMKINNITNRRHLQKRKETKLNANRIRKWQK